MLKDLGKKLVGFTFTLALVFMIMPTTTYAAAIGITESGSKLTVDTKAGLIYTINTNNGDLISCKLNGTELSGTAKGKYSHISSGLGTSTDVSYTTSPSGATIVITCETDTLTHYYISRAGENVIYMATYITEEPSVGELRYVFRGNADVLTNGSKYSDVSDTTVTVESSDVFGYANGQTVSKYYGNDQAKDLSIAGVTGNNVGVFVDYGNRETSSGGPFFRDIQFQLTTDAEIYNYMNSGHEQTEDFRMGLHGPYAYIFTTGDVPSEPDYSFMSSLNLKGWVSSRGKVVLNGLSNMNSDYTYTIGFANSDAQYWTEASSSGKATCADMKPGTYTMTVYKGELEVYTEEGITVSAGKTTTLNTRTITDDPGNTSILWRVGKWDGKPTEFLNGNTITVRHPSDSRNASWGPVTYAAGNKTNTFPALQARLLNTPTTITFNLTAAQIKERQLNIGITAAYNSGRPLVTINGNTLKTPSASTQPKSRSFTIGTYRGNNTTFSWDIPASYFVEGTNTITINVASGSSDLGTYLSAGFVYDCVELTK